MDHSVKHGYILVIKTGSPKMVNKDCLHPKRKGCGSPGARKTQLVSKDFLQHLQKKVQLHKEALRKTNSAPKSALLRMR